MGTGVIYYEELADDMSETWDVFDSIFRDKIRIRAYPSTEPFCHPVQSIHFDPDLPYDDPISSMHPDGGFLHPSPPPEPYYSPPSDPPFQQFHPPELPEATMAPPLSYYPPLYFPPGMDGYGYIPYDPLVDVAVDDAGIIGEPYDPVDDFDGLFVPQRDAVVPMGEDRWEEEELSAGLRAASLGDRSEVST
ncbi:hypothetical protein PIB30_111230, partial [Stylosanthes scabra]|nr:hypothetical protein [Stylosanthes scabra]